MKNLKIKNTLYIISINCFPFLLLFHISPANATLHSLSYSLLYGLFKLIWRQSANPPIHQFAPRVDQFQHAERKNEQPQWSRVAEVGEDECSSLR